MCWALQWITFKLLRTSRFTLMSSARPQYCHYWVLLVFRGRIIYLPPFKHGKWQTGLWQWSPFHSVGHIQTLGLIQCPPLTQGGLHRGNWHCLPTYSGGHLHTLCAKHSPPFWHLGEQGAAIHVNIKQRISNAEREQRMKTLHQLNIKSSASPTDHYWLL